MREAAVTDGGSAFVSEDEVREAYLIDDEADEEIGFVSMFVPISAISADDAMFPARVID